MLQMDDISLDALIKENNELVEFINQYELKNMLINDKKQINQQNTNIENSSINPTIIKSLENEISLIKKSNLDLIDKILNLEGKFLSIAQNKLVPELKNDSIIKFKTDKGDFYLNKIDITMLSEFLNSTVVFAINQKNIEMELNKTLYEKLIFMCKYIDNKR